MCAATYYDNYFGYCRQLLSQFDSHQLEALKLEMSYGFERVFLLSYCLACCWPALGAKSDLRVIRQWAEVDYVFPSDEAKQIAMDKNFFVRGNSVPIDVDVHHRKSNSRIFITIPRFDMGRPATLATIDNQGRLVAYPDYAWHDNQGNNCDGLTSVFRVAIDECNRLWVMDTGKIGDTQSCPPQLLAFNLMNDELIYRHVVDASNYHSQSLFITPVVDVRPRTPGDCSDTYVYVADVSGFGMLVVDVANNRSWRLTHKNFFPYPSKGTFTIDGESFDLMDGIFGMALTPYRAGNTRYLYFHSLASTKENVVRTDLLRNYTSNSVHALDSKDVTEFLAERPNQSAAEAMDRNGIMFFGLMDPPSIWCWNSATEYSPRNFHRVAFDQETLQFASGIKIVNNLKGEQELWVLTCSFQRVMTGSISSDKINYRIHAERVSVLLEKSPCNIPPKSQNSGHYGNLLSDKIYMPET